MEYVNEFFKYALEILALLGVVIEITPIKFSPIKWLGNKFNADITKSINELKKTVDDNDIDTIRHRIASFENLCRMDVNHNQIQKHQYIAIFKDIDKWDKYHIKYPFLNGELKAAIENIEESYKKAKFDI